MVVGCVGCLSAFDVVTAIDFSVDNAFSPTFVIGDDSAPCYQYGRATIEGSFTAFFNDATLINRFLNETNSALQVSVNDPSGDN